MPYTSSSGLDVFSEMFFDRLLSVPSTNTVIFCLLTINSEIQTPVSKVYTLVQEPIQKSHEVFSVRIFNSCRCENSVSMVSGPGRITKGCSIQNCRVFWHSLRPNYPELDEF